MKKPQPWALIGFSLVFMAGSWLAPVAWAAEACPATRTVTPKGATAQDIQQAIVKGGPGSTVLLSGNYRIDATLRLLDGTTLCTTEGATLTWVDPARAGMIIDATSASATTVRNLILDGRGIAVRGRGHVIESNLIRNIQQPAYLQQDKRRWGERHGIFIPDQGDDLTIRQNLFSNIVDTGVMGYNIDRSLIADNKFGDVHEGIHLFSVSRTQIRNNSGQGFRAMSIEIQGDNLPGLVVEANRFGRWHKDHEKGAYAMSIVAGASAVIRDNVIEGSPLMAAGLEIGGHAPLVQRNQLTDANIIVTDSPDAVLQANQLIRAGIVKDVNRVKGGKLTIQDNVIQDAPRAAITTDHWWGYDQVIIQGNQISKKLSSDTQEFVGILASDFQKQPLRIENNRITISKGGVSRHVPVTCIKNGGSQGNLRGMRVVGNTCDGGGVATFSDSNAPGGHIDVTYERNQLMNLRDTITGDTTGLRAKDNQLVNVTADQARLGNR